MSPEDRRTLRVGLVGFVVAVALILGAWRIVTSDLPDFRASAAVSAGTPTSEPTVSGTPSETFVVPSPPPVTPTESPTSPAPEPAPAAAQPAIAAPPVPVTTPNAAPPPAQPAPSAAQVRNIDLSCAQNGKRVEATLTFSSDGPVAASVTAGGRTDSSRGSGTVQMRVSGPGDKGARCSAVVDGQQVGPISGGRGR